MKKNLWKILVMVGFAAMFNGCYPDGAQFIEEYDLVYTNHDDGYSFAGKPKYAMSDSVVKVKGDLLNGDPVEFLNPYYGNMILDRIKANMSSLGYTLVTDTAQADFIILNSSLEVTSVSYYYDYWGYYYPGGWYYPYPVVSSYTTGTVAMIMLDRKNLNPSGKARVVWNGVINGLLEGSSTAYPDRITKTVNQAFSQSSYLKQ